MPVAKFKKDEFEDVPANRGLAYSIGRGVRDIATEKIIPAAGMAMDVTTMPSRKAANIMTNIGRGLTGAPQEARFDPFPLYSKAAGLNPLTTLEQEQQAAAQAAATPAAAVPTPMAPTPMTPTPVSTAAGLTTMQPSATPSQPAAGQVVDDRTARVQKAFGLSDAGLISGGVYRPDPYTSLSAEKPDESGKSRIYGTVGFAPALKTPYEPRLGDTPAEIAAMNAGIADYNRSVLAMRGVRMAEWKGLTGQDVGAAQAEAARAGAVYKTAQTELLPAETESMISYRKAQEQALAAGGKSGEGRYIKTAVEVPSGQTAGFDGQPVMIKKDMLYDTASKKFIDPLDIQESVVTELQGIYGGLSEGNRSLVKKYFNENPEATDEDVLNYARGLK